jgi:hypothetical protein
MKRNLFLSLLLLVATVLGATAEVTSPNPSPAAGEPGLCQQAEPKVPEPLWTNGICGDCPGNCADTCAASRQSCLTQGGNPSACETKYQNCLLWCNN